MIFEKTYRILLVEDEASDEHLLRLMLRQVVTPVFDITWVQSLSEAKQYLSKNSADVVLLDLTLPDSSGLETVRMGRMVVGVAPIIVLTGHNDPEFALSALEEGAQDYLVKGDFEADALVRAIRYAITRSKLEQRLHEAEERWRFALEGAGDGVWDWNIQTSAVTFSRRLKEMLGFTEEEMADRLEEWTSRIHPEDLEGVMAELQAYLAGDIPSYSCEHRLRCKSGHWKWILDRGKVVSRDSAGKPLRMIGTHTDIDELKSAEEMLRLSNTVFNTVDEAILVSDAENRILMVNPSFTRVTGYASEEVLGKNPHLLSSGKHSAEFYRQLWQQINTAGSWSGEIWNRRKNGEIYIEWVSIKRVCDKHGKLTHYFAAFSDITARKSNEEHVLHQAQYDALTNLPNRALLFDRLQQALAQAKRDKSRLAVLYIDFDKFKPINDNLGHAVGDHILQEAGNRMQGCVREADTVARIGGDEFVVLLPLIENDQDAFIVAEKIRFILNQPFEIDGQTLSISSSTGIAIYPEHGASEDEIMGNADIAMYQAKVGGRNNVMLFNKSMRGNR